MWRRCLRRLVRGRCPEGALPMVGSALPRRASRTATSPRFSPAPTRSPAVIPADAGIHFALYRFASEATAKSGFVLLRRPSHFSLRGQREVTKRKATPLSRLTGLRPVRYASGLRGLSTVHPWTDAKLARIHASHPAGFSSARPPLQRGGQVKSRARRAQRLGDRSGDHHRLCVVVHADAVAEAADVAAVIAATSTATVTVAVAVAVALALAVAVAVAGALAGAVALAWPLPLLSIPPPL